MTGDFEVVPDLVCGQTYRHAATEASVPAWREGKVTAFYGCGEPMVWLRAYRCRWCARWLHDTCADRHFEEDTAVRALTEAQGTIERLREALELIQDICGDGDTQDGVAASSAGAYAREALAALCAAPAPDGAGTEG